MIIILVLVVALFKFVYFSETQVQLLDENGNPINEGKIRISYSCDRIVFDPGGGRHPKGFGYREGLTDSAGVVNFNPLNEFFVFNLPFMYNCKKYITSEKEGYCPFEGIGYRTVLHD